MLACCNGDTWASELGTALSNSDPVLVTTWKKVPKGTNGGISLIGTICSTAGGFLIGISHYLTIVFFSDKTLLNYAPPQWPVMFYGAFAGFIGSLVDSFLGATLQYSGKYNLFFSSNCCVSREKQFLIPGVIKFSICTLLSKQCNNQ